MSWKVEKMGVNWAGWMGKLKAEKMGLNWAGWKGPKKVCRMGLKKVHQTEMCLGLRKVDLTVCQMGPKMGKQKAWQMEVNWAGWKGPKKVRPMGLRKVRRMVPKLDYQSEKLQEKGGYCRVS